MDTYIIKVNGLYLEGYDYENTDGQTGARHGYYIESNDMEAMILTEEEEKAKLVEGAINLKSQLDRIVDRIRYGNLELKHLEIIKTEGGGD